MSKGQGSMCSEVNDNLVETLECIGLADNKRHRYIPWKDETICGQKILRKKVLSNDILTHYCCSICDAYQDERDIIAEEKAKS